MTSTAAHRRSAPRPRALSAASALAALLALAGLGARASAQPAPRALEEAAYLERPEGVINQLRWLNKRQRALALRLDPLLALTPREAAEAVQRAQLALLGGEGLEVIFDLRAQLGRAGAMEGTSAPQLLSALAEAEWEAGLERSAREHLSRALTSAESAPSAYERALITFGRLFSGTPAQLKGFWGTYAALCERVGRPPSDAARYAYGKALYRGGDLAGAEGVMSALRGSQTFALRASFFMGVIALARDDAKVAAERLGALQVTISEARALAARRRPAVERAAAPPLRPQEAPEGWEVLKSSPRLTVSRVRPPEEGEGAAAGLRREGDEESAALRGLSPELREVLARAERELALDAGVSAARSDAPHKTPPREDAPVLEQVSAALSAALARLAVVEGRYEEAWQRYRAVPLGTAWGREAALESIYTLRARGLHLQSDRLIDQLLKGHTDDVASFQLSLWKAEALIKGGRPKEGRAVYAAITAALKRSAYVVERAGESKLLFPPEVLAWLSDGEARAARAMSRRIYESEVQLKQAQRDWNALLRAHKGKRYGAVQIARAFVRRQTPALRALELKLGRLAPLWRSWAGALAPTALTLGLKPEQLTAERVTESARALAGRLGALDALASARQSSLERGLEEELPALRAELEGLMARHKLLTGELERLSGLLKAAALERVRGHIAQMQLGATEEVYWLKELSTERAAAALVGRRDELATLSRLWTQEEDAATRLVTLEHLAPFLAGEEAPASEGEGAPALEESGAPEGEAEVEPEVEPEG